MWFLFCICHTKLIYFNFIVNHLHYSFHIDEVVEAMIKILEQKTWLILIIAAATFLDRLDLTIVNIAIPHLSTVFHVSVTQMDWVSNSYLIALACFIPVSGWLGARYSLKNVFLFATAIFAIGTLLCAFSFNLSSMVAFRFIQGIGGAMIIPVGMAILYNTFHIEEYASVTACIFLPSLIAPALAPFLGAVIMTTINWHWIFLLAVPVCIFIYISAIVVIPNEPRPITERPPLDIFGVVLICGLFIILQLFFSYSGKYGLTFYSPMILLLIALLAYIGYRYESWHKNPLINLNYFKNRTFVTANLIQLAFQACHFGSFFLIGLYLQVGLGFSAINTGLILGMQAIGAIVMNRPAVYFYKKHGPRLQIIIGLSGIAVLSYAILFLIRDNTTPALYSGLLILFLRGLFSGVCGTPIQTLSVISFQKSEMGHVNALFNMCRQMAISFGIAISAVLISMGAKLNHDSLAGALQPYTTTYSTFHYAFMLIPVFCLLGIITMLLYKPHSI